MKKSIYLQQCENDDNLYIVDRLVNTLDPEAGSVLKRPEIQELINSIGRTGGMVHITRGNRK